MHTLPSAQSPPAHAEAKGDPPRPGLEKVAIGIGVEEIRENTIL